MTKGREKKALAAEKKVSFWLKFVFDELERSQKKLCKSMLKHLSFWKFIGLLSWVDCGWGDWVVIKSLAVSASSRTWKRKLFPLITKYWELEKFSELSKDDLKDVLWSWVKWHDSIELFIYYWRLSVDCQKYAEKRVALATFFYNPEKLISRNQ